MSDKLSMAIRGCTASRAPCGVSTRGARQPRDQGRDFAWLEFEKPDLERAEAFAPRSGLPSRCAPATSCTCGQRRPRAVRADPPWPAFAVCRPGVRCRRTPDLLRLADATGPPYAPCRRRWAGWGLTWSTPAGFAAGGVRPSSARRAASPGAARVQLRLRAGPGQLHSAPSAGPTRVGSGWVMSCCRPPSTSRR